MKRQYTVKAVAGVAGVSVRTLHHYDHIGLLKPSATSAAGYRLYGEEDLERLQQVLFFRELGFSLEDVRTIVSRPGFDRKEALRAHRLLLIEQQQRLGRLVELVDRTIDTIEGKTTMSNQQRFAAFDDSTAEQYREEARQRWGDTDAYKESQRRAATYSKADWAQIKAEGEKNTLALAALMDRSPSDPAVQAQVDAWWKHIDSHFYTMTPALARGLSDMYVADPRFTATYDKVKPGLAAFLRDAIHVYCDALPQPS